MQAGFQGLELGGVLLRMTLLIGLGCLLGCLYFGGLWLTLRKLPRAPKPMLLIWGSYCLRLGFVLGIFHLILQRSDQDQLLMLLLASFFGFLLSRNWLISCIRPQDRGNDRIQATRTIYSGK